MKAKPAVCVLFIIAAVYDGVLGAAFLLAAGPLFEWAGVVPPNHLGYVHFPAALLLVFAAMFAAVARNPAGNRNLIPYGILLKVSYCSVILYHWLTAGLPYIWKPFCIADLFFIIAFVWAWKATRQTVG